MIWVMDQQTPQDQPPGASLPVDRSDDQGMHDHEAPPERGLQGSSVGGAVAWTIAILVSAFVIIGNHLAAPEPLEPQPATTAESDAPAPEGLLGFASRYAVFADQYAPGDGERAVEELQLFATSEAAKVRIAIVAGEILGGEEALERLREIKEVEREEPREDVDLLEQIYTEGPETLSASQAEQLIERHKWFGHAALAFEQPADNEHREIMQRKVDTAGAGMLVAFFGGVLLGLVSLGLFITAIVLIAVGKIRPKMRRPLKDSAGIEVVAIFMGGFLVVGIAVEILRPLLGNSSALLLWLLLLAPLWLLVRGMPVARWRELIGWHRGEGVLKEAACGVLGYLACGPIVVVGVVITLVMAMIYSLIAGEPSAPTHPLPDQLAGGGALNILQLYLLAAVWAPIVEETIFRGAFYGHLRARLHPLLCAAITGVWFAAIHPQGFLAIPALGSIGFSFALLREWRGSIIAPAVAHAMNNGVVVTLLVIAFFS
jgi:membrane protease YdiL (CAAX protease family)